MWYKILVMVISSIVLTGCLSEEDNLTIEGIKGEIVQIDSNSILIEDGVDQVDLKYIDNTIFTGKELDDLVLGDKVQTWYKNQPLDSNPMQATAAKIEYID